MPGGSCRIPKAAALFGIVVTEHSVVLARAQCRDRAARPAARASATYRRSGFFQRDLQASSPAGASRRPAIHGVYGGTGPVAARARRRRCGRSAWDRRACVRRRRCSATGVTSLTLPLSTICSTPASVISCRIQGVSCVEYAHGPDKRLDRRETPQIPVDVAGQHGRVCLRHPACGSPFLMPRHLECGRVPAENGSGRKHAY